MIHRYPIVDCLGAPRVHVHVFRVLVQAEALEAVAATSPPGARGSAYRRRSAARCLGVVLGRITVSTRLGDTVSGTHQWATIQVIDGIVWSKLYIYMFMFFRITWDSEVTGPHLHEWCRTQ